ncbi:sensor histidine kinase [Gelidibacter salicanalis]|uniref:histidine kinase n=1 Tax=Gelidibacter salicanalis TaxID=291193 RepID=A0A934KWX7_9FLAO|nr:ATP-binding protein [Gelidibacter salicanalis]MBJ7881828.1 HAMP domain-containing protein [Gelidibacter salicanalis]
MKIRHRLILAFGVLILVLLVEIILNQVITNRATQTYGTVQSKINPVINVINHYESIHKELNLLTSNRVNGDNKISSINRLNGIVEVELTYIEEELAVLKKELPEKSVDRLLLEKLIIDTEKLISTTIRLNNLLNNKKEYISNLELARTIHDNTILKLNSSIDKGIDHLNLNYKRAFEAYSIELANNLKSVSKIILITGISGILLALIVSVQIIYSISAPIYNLKKAALKMSRGHLDERIHIKGNNELAELGNSFNNMSIALKKSFNEQEKQIVEIKSVNKELEQFVYVASHDLQEPLRTMSSYVGLIKDLYIGQLDDKAVKYMTHVEDASLRMKTLIKDLLDYSKIGKEKTVTGVNLNTIAANILLDLELIIKDTNASVKFDNLPTVNGLELELKQLFQNLINNGLKFRKADTAPLIEITVEEQSKYWLFAVKDNGIGMDKQYFERVFVIFQRLHNRNDYHGTGIGLSICKKIVDMHKGKIWIESEVDQGSTFYFTIFKKLKKDEKI